MGCAGTERQVLSKQHCWDIGKGIESAYMVDVEFAYALHVGKGHRKRLAQGWMATADVFCTRCHTQLGWTFTEDFAGGNSDQLGKFGLVTSVIKQLPPQPHEGTPGKFSRLRRAK